MTSAAGKLIVIEGLEGAGKSTAVSTLVSLMQAHRIPVLTTREPGGTKVGELLRGIIKSPEYKESLCDQSELLLMYTARLQLVEEVIKPALETGTWVIADRFELSTFAYQGGGRGLDLELIQQLSKFCLKGFKPDLTLYLDLPPEEGMRRVKKRGAFDRIEQQSMDFFHKVHQMYLHCIALQPDVITIDAMQPLPQVQEQITKAVQHFIGF